MSNNNNNHKPLALVVEDDRKLAQIFAAALKSVEFETELIDTGGAALTRLAQVVPALVVLDMHLPQVSGKDILPQIRADERLAQTKVIVATADYGMAERMRDTSDLVLLKPISFEQLRDLAARLHRLHKRTATA